MTFASLPIWMNLLVFVASGAIVWIAGTRMADYASRIGTKAGMSQAFAGFLLLGGATSLPELATVSTSAYFGDAALAVNSLLGSVAMNVLLLAFADAVIGRDALTSTPGSPTVMLQGVWGILLLAIALVGIASGEFEVYGIGVWSASLLPGFLIAVWLTSGYSKRAPWTLTRKHRLASSAAAHSDGEDAEPLGELLAKALAASAALLIAGYLLSRSGDAIAEQSGLGTGLVGFLLVGLSTSLPEISSMVGAVRRRNYDLALGDVLGTNLFDLVLIPVADVIYLRGAILKEAGAFEMVAALLGIILTAIYLIGLLERRDRTILRMGYDSLAAILLYTAGVAVLYSLSR
jgi:cation:H+ antiporter